MLKINKMLYNFLGSSGLKVSNICLGTMTFGEDKGGRPYANEEESHQMLDKFVEMGGNFIDTANVYAGGRSETIIGNWLKRQKREKLILATKCGRTIDPEDPNGTGACRFHIMTALDASLKRLQTDYVDLLYVHLFDYGTPIEETLSTLNDLVRAGKVRYIGLSNLKGWQLQKYVELSKQMGYDKIVALQEQYNLLVRSPEWEVAEVCENEGVAFLPWSPLKGGWLSGRVSRDCGQAPPGTRMEWTSGAAGRAHHSHPDWGWFASNDQAWAVIDKCEEIGKKHDKTVPQVAIRWLLQKRFVPSVVIGVRTLEQLDGCLAANGWQLTKDEMAELDATSNIGAPYPYDYIPLYNKGRFRPS